MERLEDAAAAAARVLRGGGLILYPTDTVWGIGCDATDAGAVERLCRLKGHADKRAMIVLCDSLDRVARHVDRAPAVAYEVLEMATTPLTLILPGAVGVAPNLIPDGGTLGVRVPDHAFCRELIRRLGRPVVSTSANLAGEPPARTLEEADEAITRGVDLVVSPRWAGRPTGRPSSIMRFAEDGAFEIIRP